MFVMHFQASLLPQPVADIMASSSVSAESLECEDSEFLAAVRRPRQQHRVSAKLRHSARGCAPLTHGSCASEAAMVEGATGAKFMLMGGGLSSVVTESCEQSPAGSPSRFGTTSRSYYSAAGGASTRYSFLKMVSTHKRSPAVLAARGAADASSIRLISIDFCSGAGGGTDLSYVRTKSRPVHLKMKRKPKQRRNTCNYAGAHMSTSACGKSAVGGGSTESADDEGANTEEPELRWLAPGGSLGRHQGAMRAVYSSSVPSGAVVGLAAAAASGGLQSLVRGAQEMPADYQVERASGATPVMAPSCGPMRYPGQSHYHVSFTRVGPCAGCSSIVGLFVSAASFGHGAAAAQSLWSRGRRLRRQSRRQSWQLRCFRCGDVCRTRYEWFAPCFAIHTSLERRFGKINDSCAIILSVEKVFIIWKNFDDEDRATGRVPAKNTHWLNYMKLINISENRNTLEWGWGGEEVVFWLASVKQCLSIFSSFIIFLNSLVGCPSSQMSNKSVPSCWLWLQELLSVGVACWPVEKLLLLKRRRSCGPHYVGSALKANVLRCCFDNVTRKWPNCNADSPPCLRCDANQCKRKQ